jgi:Ca2+-dependent lipid-binding protein
LSYFTTEWNLKGSQSHTETTLVQTQRNDPHTETTLVQTQREDLDTDTTLVQTQREDLDTDTTLVQIQREDLDTDTTLVQIQRNDPHTETKHKFKTMYYNISISFKISNVYCMVDCGRTEVLMLFLYLHLPFVFVLMLFLYLDLPFVFVLMLFLYLDLPWGRCRYRNNISTSVLPQSTMQYTLLILKEIEIL